MTGMIQAAMASPIGSINPAFNLWQVVFTQIAGAGGCAATLQWNPDGTLTAAGVGTKTSTDGVSWFLPSTPGVGSSYWIKATAISGAPDVGTMNTWLSLATAQKWGFNTFNTAANKTCTLTFQLATDAAGATIVLTQANNIITANHS